MIMSMLGIYLHIPFCRKKCLYCDFSSYSGAEHLFEPYTAALCQQIAAQGGLSCNQAVDTVYIGGGTPSLLPIHLIEKIIAALQAHFAIQNTAEISMEINPGTVTQEYLSALKATGVNRLSFGVQSFNDDLLVGLGRIHKTTDSVSVLKYAAAAKFDNLSIDLMYGLPGQTFEGFCRELKRAAALPVNHISMYGLKLEEGTPLAAAFNQGRLEMPDEAAEEAMYDEMVDYLPRQGLARYEISNFAYSKMECRHNLKYWHYQPYLGLGAAAHSFLNGERISAEPDIQGYIDAVMAGRSPVVMQETLSPGQMMAEFVFLALRTAAGMGLTDFARRFDVDFFRHYGPVCEKMLQQKLIATNDKQIWLTNRGMKLGNIVFSNFLPE